MKAFTDCCGATAGWLGCATVDRVAGMTLAYSLIAEPTMGSFFVQRFAGRLDDAIRSRQDGMVLSYRFLELDRGTLPIEDLFAKLMRYVDLRRCWDDYWQADSRERERMPAWPSRYLAWPSLMVVFANPDRGSPRLSMKNVMTMCRHAPEIMRDPGWFFFALFDELVASGPFAAVFRRLHGEALVNWLGEPAGVEGRGA